MSSITNAMRVTVLAAYATEFEPVALMVAPVTKTRLFAEGPPELAMPSAGGEPMTFMNLPFYTMPSSWGIGWGWIVVDEKMANEMELAYTKEKQS